MMRTAHAWHPLNELAGFRRNATAFLNDGSRTSVDSDGPAFNLDAGETGFVLSAELPGYDPEAFDVSVRNDTVTVRGKRSEERVEGARPLVRERPAVEFEKTFRLPFPVDADSTEAVYEQGVFTLRLNRPEEQKPRKISVRTA